MSNEKAIEYDYRASIAYMGTLMMICALFAGFTFTGAIVVLTSLGDPSLLFSQIVLAILVFALGSSLTAMWELQHMTTLLCLQSPKPIIPKYQARWRIIQRSLELGSNLFPLSITVMFLLMNLKWLFVFSIIVLLLGSIYANFYRWGPIKKEMNDYLEKRFDKSG